MSASEKNRPVRLLFVQTQAEMAGAQEISRLLGDELSRPAADGTKEFEAHHLFLYRKTSGCDGFPNVLFAAQQNPRGLVEKAHFFGRVVSLIHSVKPDVLLTFQHYGNIVGAPVGRLLRVPRIIANHVSAPATISGPVRRIDRLLGLSGFYDVITVNSQATWRDYQAYPERYRSRIAYVPHGFSDKTTSVSRNEARAAFGLPVDARVIGTVARLHPLKRIDLAIRTLPHLPGVHLAVAGQGPDHDRLLAVAAETGVSDRLHFAGEIPPARVGTFLASLDAFVFPSEAETFGLAAVEAAQAGIPVVSNDMPVMREVLQVDGTPCALFVDASDTKGFAATIRTVLDDAPLHKDLADKGRRLAGTHSLAAMVDEYRRLIRAAAHPAANNTPQHQGPVSSGLRSESS